MLVVYISANVETLLFGYPGSVVTKWLDIVETLLQQWSLVKDILWLDAYKIEILSLKVV